MTMPTSIKLPSGESIPTQLLCPPPPKKHHRETRSQYLHRVSLVAGHVPGSEVEDYLRSDTFTSTTPSRKILNDQPIRSCKEEKREKTTSLKSNIAKSRYSATRSIAIYKQRKYLRSCLRRILFVIYRYALKRRYKKYSAYATIIQKYVRRDFVTSHLESLILALMKRKSDIEAVKASVTHEMEILREPKQVFPIRDEPQIVQRQLSNDSATGALKLFRQVSGNSDENAAVTRVSKPPMHPMVSSSSSRGLIGGVIPAQLPPTLSQRSLGADTKQNPKTLNQKRSFSRTYSGVLARQEELKSIIHKEEDGAEAGGKFKTLSSLGSDLSDNQPYSPAATYVPTSPEIMSKARKGPSSGMDRKELLSKENPSSTSLSDDENPIAFPKSSNSHEDLNRLSLGSESTVKTSDTLKRDDPKQKPLEPRNSFSISNLVSLTRPFGRSDNKSPVPGRPNLATITEGESFD
jgi:hypothetical protein